MRFGKVLAATLLLAGTAALPALASDGADHSQLMAQATQNTPGPHFDPPRGDGPQPHNPNPSTGQAGGPAAHFDAPRGDGPQPHRPDGTGQPNGAAAHFDATQGGGQQPHVPGRGAPQPGR